VAEGSKQRIEASQQGSTREEQEERKRGTGREEQEERKRKPGTGNDIHQEKQQMMIRIKDPRTIISSLDEPSNTSALLARRASRHDVTAQ